MRKLCKARQDITRQCTVSYRRPKANITCNKNYCYNWYTFICRVRGWSLLIPRHFSEDCVYHFRIDKTESESSGLTKNASKSRKKRQEPKIAPVDPHEKNKYTTVKNSGDTNITVDANADDTLSTNDSELVYEKAVVYHDTSFILSNLGHFEEYNIEV